MSKRGKPSVPAVAAIWCAAIFPLVWAAIYYRFFLQTNPALPGIFRALVLPWTFSLANSPLLECAEAFIAIALVQTLGLLLTRTCLSSSPGVSPGRLRWAIAFPIGFGVSGIFLELLTMAHGLCAAAVWLLWIVMITLAWKSAPLRDCCQRHFLTTENHTTLREQNPHSLFPIPHSRAEGALLIAAISITTLITLCTFWHAIFFPETYWDSLILYLGYGRMTFLQHAFPFKAEAQVGIGLGANYPHLYSTFGAASSTLFAHWSTLHERLAAPLAGAASCALVYYAVKLCWNDRLIAAATMLLFRCVPHSIAFTTYASDYAFAILFMAAFIALAANFFRAPTRGNLALLTVIPASSMHLNYLMGILWVPWFFVVLSSFILHLSSFKNPHSRFILATFLIGVASASPWYIRNTILTNNPVYAFFPQIFTHSIRVNPAVLKSAELEWFRNGDGIGQVAEKYHDWSTGEQRDVGADDFRRAATLGDKLRASFLFWIGFDLVAETADGRAGSIPLLDRLRFLATSDISQSSAALNPRIYYSKSYKMAPLIPAYFFPAVIVSIILLFVTRRRLAHPALRPAVYTLATAALLSGLLLSYMYFLADFYLYQIIGILGPAAIFSSVIFAAARAAHRIVLRLAVCLVLLWGVVPGLAMAVMNFKISRENTVDGVTYSPFNLDAFRNPGTDPRLFLRMQYGDEVNVWDYVNENLKGEKILTHENRHLMFDPSITFVHLDDWDMQKGYDLPDAPATAKFLHDHGIHYYLRTPNENNQKINARLGMKRLEQGGYLTQMYSAGDVTLFKIVEKELP
ncbi:hypothetical protein BH09SUM1_BH09SUM1_18220 [soil metagenome]